MSGGPAGTSEGSGQGEGTAGDPARQEASGIGVRRFSPHVGRKPSCVADITQGSKSYAEPSNSSWDRVPVVQGMETTQWHADSKDRKSKITALKTSSEGLRESIRQVQVSRNHQNQAGRQAWEEEQDLVWSENRRELSTRRCAQWDCLN